MKRPPLIIYAGLLIILFILMFLVFTLPFQKSNISDVSVGVRPTPTSSRRASDQLQLTPTYSYPQPTKTGAMEDVPAIVADYATQRQNLKSKLPLNNAYFSITFDYATDKFIVTLKGDKVTATQQFQAWLKKNYSLIPISKFTLK